MDILPLWDGMCYYEHQVQGVHWMLLKEMTGTEVAPATIRGGLQCDDMGLGKTIQILGTMRNNPQPKTLLLCPLAMVSTWVETARRSGFPTYTVSGGGKTKHWALVKGGKGNKGNKGNKGKSSKGEGSKMATEPSLYVTNYDQLVHNPRIVMGSGESTDRDWMEGAEGDEGAEGEGWDRVVCDEAHRLRNPNTVIYNRARKIQARLRWAVTGTPIVNNFKDAAALFHFIGVPGSISTGSSLFYELIGGLVIRRSMEEIRGVVEGVPPAAKFECKTLDFASEEEEELYRACQGLVDKLKYHRDSLGRNEKLVLLLRLRQLSVSPQVYTEAMRLKDKHYDLSFTAPSTKMLALADLIELTPTGKFLVFCSFIRELEILQAFLQETFELEGGIELYHGGLTGAERTATLARVKKPECRVMLVQLQSGGVGLNLQEFDQIAFMSPWWTAALMDQAVARAVRIGQTKAVTVTHLRLAEEEAMNIDQIMMDSADRKRGFLELFFRYTTPPEVALADAAETVAEAEEADAEAVEAIAKMLEAADAEAAAAAVAEDAEDAEDAEEDPQ